MASSYTKDPFLIVIGSLDLRACQNVTQIVVVVEDEEKRQRVRYLFYRKSFEFKLQFLDVPLCNFHHCASCIFQLYEFLVALRPDEKIIVFVGKKSL